ncbi:MAG: SH3 domain-containing protein [Chloroflexi bacterium]|nr:SH3 domain-containing protein [Chloroflexota bacterium]
MNLLTFVPYLPFFALLYALFALLQALRHRQQGVVATLLALVSILVPFAAYLFVSDAAARAGLLQSILVNAGGVFVTSLLTLLIERRNAQRDSSRSYGMLGLGLSVLLVVAMFALPLLTTSTSSAAVPQAFVNATNNTSGDTVLVSNQTSSNTAAQPEATQSADSTPTAVAQALTAQTGLSADDLLTKVQAGSTLADLISANSGDQAPVISAIAQALDDLVAAGGRQADMISSFGSDTTDVATQLVAGTLGQAQNFLLPQLISGQMPTPPNGAPSGDAPSGNPPSGDFAPPSDASTSTDNSANTPVATASPQDATGSDRTGTADATSEAAPEGNTVSTADATPIIRPTRITFPTATATPDATEESTAEATAVTGELAANTATCSLTIDYNLNLRTQPTTDGSTVLLSIPFGSAVTADGKTSDGWYHVSYDNQTGWVLGDYVTAGASCSALAVTSAA